MVTNSISVVKKGLKIITGQEGSLGVCREIAYSAVE
jgi:hypothetical protein